MKTTNMDNKEASETESETRAIPLVSVTMLAYNHGQYIHRAIEGVLQQKTSFSIELIIGEDHSPDNTLETVLKYQREYPQIIRVLTTERNLGAPENSRRCEKECRGQYLAFCEGDDYWIDPERLEKQVTFLKENLEYAMVHTAFQMHYTCSGKTVSEPLRISDELDDGNAFDEILSGKRYVWGLTVCIRKSIYEEVLRECPECYDSRFLMGDTQRWLEIARRGKIKYFPEATATRQVLLESATQSQNPERVLRFALSNMDVYDHYIKKYGCPPDIKKATKARCAFYVLTSAYAASNVPASRIGLAEYVQNGINIPIQARLYYIGSQSTFLKKLVMPVIRVSGFAQKVLTRLC
jgi:glycosyltransferase involved in cell wall biosynthesis